MTGFISTLPLALLIVTSSGSECPCKPVHLLVFFDATIQAERVRMQIEKLAEKVIVAMANHSEIVIDRVENNVTVMEMMKFNITGDRSWASDMKEHPDMEQYWNTSSISSEALEEGFTKSFSLNRYRTKAEIALLFVASNTKLDKVTPMLTLKKRFVVFIGAKSSNEVTWKRLATTDHHFFNVRSLDEIYNVADSIIRQIANDSNHMCDTNFYRKERSIKCINCSGVCVDGNSRHTETCGLRCPYLCDETKPKADSDNTTGFVKVEDDSDNTTRDVVIGLVSALVAVVIVIGIFWYKRRKPKPLHIGEPVPESGREQVQSLVKHSDEEMTSGDGEHSEQDGGRVYSLNNTNQIIRAPELPNHAAIGKAETGETGVRYGMPDGSVVSLREARQTVESVM